MDTILQGLLDVAGVNAALVLDGSGRLLACRGKAVYDRALCEQVSGSLVKAIDSIQLQQDDWESITAQFSDGKLLLRSLGSPAGAACFLAVVADGTLNPSFGTVAIRVAAGKLKRALEGGGNAVSAPAATGSSVLPPAPPPPASASQTLPSDSRVANTGVSWTTKAGSSVTLTGIGAADPASAAFLARCSKEMARAVGPMAKVYVQEAVRRLSADASFSMALKGKLLEDLAAQIEDAGERAAFVKALERA
jgi:hypothetical protein